MSKFWLPLSGHCASIQTQVKEIFFLLYGPPQPMTGILGTISRFPRSTPVRGPTIED